MLMVRIVYLTITTQQSYTQEKRYLLEIKPINTRGRWSTRGVQLKDVTPLDRDSSGDSSNTQVQTVQGGDTGNSKSGNWSINIGDITFPNAQMGSERDVKATADELVTEIVARLTKLSPNMT